MSAARRLPARPSLEQLRKQAKELLGELRATHAAAQLADAQLALAREYGFESWPRLVHHVESLSAAPAIDRHGFSTTAPFFRIDRQENLLEPKAPLSSAEWDVIFGVMTEQGITGLNAGGQLTDDAVKRLARLGHVTRLDLGACRRLTDDGLLQLAGMPQLQSLELSGEITDRGLEVLRHLPGLRRFAIFWNRRISDAGVANLTFCDQLEDVSLMGSTTGDGALNALTGKQRLRRFSTGRLVTDAGIPLLHQFPAFKTWEDGDTDVGLMSFNARHNSLLLDGAFTDRGFARIAGLDGVFGLNLFWHVSAMTPAGLAPLKDLANLGMLGCHGELATDAAMPHVAALPRLRMLMAQGTVAGDAGFAALSRSRTIEFIWGRECPNLRGPGFRALATMPALRGLAVSCLKVDDASLASLSSFPALTQLLPMDVSDDGFRHVGAARKLENLWCMYCRDTGDRATAHLEGLSLKSYYAGSSQITDRSLEILGRMTSLEKIELADCRGITDAGLPHLARLPNLRELAVECPRVTREGAAVMPARVRVSFTAG